MISRRLFNPRGRARAVLGAAWCAAVASLLSGCLDRPVGELPPKTTNVVVDTLDQTTVDKIDMLFVIDNSMSMADKQNVLIEALPNLVQRFVNPVCINADGDVQQAPPSPNDPCPQGYGREFRPITDIHIGVITSSLGGYGSDDTCTPPDEVEWWNEQNVDMAHLLATRPRGTSAAPSAAANGGFLKWTEDSSTDDFVPEFAALVGESGENGCGWEAPLEAWYRFLVDPAPYQEVRRQPCGANDTGNLCMGPVLNDDGTIAVDEVLLAQRAAFLRPDSLVAVIMLSDENDCSFKAHGQSWLLADTLDDSNAYRVSYRGSDACEQDVDSPCCQTCGTSRVAEGCPATAAGKPAGCDENNGYYERQGTNEPSLDDMPNLRCFEQKRRFGIDYLYPVERYSNALKLPFICPYADSLDPDECGSNQTVRNPLYSDLTGGGALPRSDSLVFLAGIVGVPWQDLAVLDEGGDIAEPLRLRVARPDPELPEREKLNWNWLLGPDPQATIPAPEDPLMIESVDPRSGVHPVTGEDVAGPNAGYMANTINGHEWNITDRSDLQYACIFPTGEEKDCSVETPPGEPNRNCDCKTVDPEAAQNPLCQEQGGGYGLTQRYAKAYPSLRQLQVLNLFGANSVVASICPKQLENQNASDYGYNPAVSAIVERLKEQLTDACLPRPLAVEADGTVPCKIVEASPNTATACSEVSAREDVEPAVANVVRKHLRELEKCGGSGGVDCDELRLCYIRALGPDDGDEFVQCLTRESTDADGWCYVDAAHMERYGLNEQQQQQGNGLLENCPETQRRKLRFVGDGTPANGTTTYYTCAGEVVQ